MENHEFDKALRDIDKNSTLPYDPLLWERMSSRLDAHATDQKPREGRRTIPFFLPLAATAAAASVLLIAGWYLSRTPADNKGAQQLAREKHTLVVPSDTIHQSPVIAQDAPQAETRITRAAASGVEGNMNVDQALAQTDSRYSAVAGTISDTIGRAVSEGPKKASADPAQKLAGLEPTPPGFDYDDAPEPTKARRTSFGVNGGFNIGQAKNNFTLGVTVKSSLGKRLHVETGLALVSGRYETYRRGATGIIGTAMAPVYEESSNQLLYLQAAPSLNYRIYRGLSAGAGVDAQRLLGDDSKAVTINSLGEENASQPQWDFGLTARMDMRLTKKLRAGMMYRESVRGISPGKQEAAQRNYLLIQLSYMIY